MEEPEEFPYSYFQDRRHNPDKEEEKEKRQDWRIKEKVKTVSVSLVLCLNIGVDPPDVVKTKPCATMECWIDPFLLPGQKALEAIGRNLQTQYEAWQPRARYRLSLDPSIEETKKLCCSLRRNAKDERILFHYNGHGVPKPTAGGELWVFNKNYTQYIPVSIYDIQTWMGSPCIFVYDCSSAGNILNSFNKFAQQRDEEHQKQPNVPPLSEPELSMPYIPYSQCIQLAACRPGETLPMSPDLPADLFTSCLTTPITIALRWFVLLNPLVENVTVDMAMKVPGRVTDRRTPLGELNWIFTSITDTIAWSVLPTDLFLSLFRNDLMVAALFRNFLLAERIMKHYNCHPMSTPALPAVHQHPMWEVWDLAADQCLSQLPQILDSNSKVEYKLSSFFSDQLSAFEVWIKKGGSRKEPPLQLPIVLQVLLSQVHRLRALLLLSKFLDFGKWAVDLALSVGIFPYVLKLLQSPALELRPVLVFIWAKLLAVDSSSRYDLLKDNGYTYFLGILSNNANNTFLVQNISEHRAMCVFILSVFCGDFLAGQQACLNNELLPALLGFLNDQDSLLRQWSCICLCNLWTDFADAKWAAFNANAHSLLVNCLQDPVPEVRAGAICALGALFGRLERIEQVLKVEQFIIVNLIKSIADGSPLVRKELAIAFSTIVKQDEVKFLYIALEILEEERRSQDNRPSSFKFSNDAAKPYGNDITGGIQHSIYFLVWKGLLALSVDPFPNVAAVACHVVDTVYHKMSHSGVMDLSLSQFVETKKKSYTPLPIPRPPPSVDGFRNSRGTVTAAGSGIFGMSLEPEKLSVKRTSSFVFSLKSLGSLVGLSTLDQNGPSASRSTPTPKRRPQSLYSQSGIIETQRPKPKPTSTEQLLNNREPSVLVKSRFFEWSCDYFMEPQMKIPEGDEPGSLKYCERQWRVKRNKALNDAVLAAYPFASSSSFDKVLTVLNHDLDTGFHEKQLLFHPYDPYIVASDQSKINVINWKTCKIVQKLSNYNPPQSSISSLQFINDEDASILLVGSNDGVVKLYRSYDEPGQTLLISSWKACTDLYPEHKGKLICEWNQQNGTLYTTGSTPVIKTWDADEELCVQEIETNCISPISSISVDPSGNMILAGFTNGSIRLFDRRTANTGPVKTFEGGEGPILSAKFSNLDSTEFLSGSKNGTIMLWDIHKKSPVIKNTPLSHQLSHFKIHDQAPIMAAVTESDDLRFMNFNGDIIGTLHPKDRFLTRSSVDIEALCLHEKYLAGAVCLGTEIMIYESECNQQARLSIV